MLPFIHVRSLCSCVFVCASVSVCGTLPLQLLSAVFAEWLLLEHKPHVSITVRDMQSCGLLPPRSAPVSPTAAAAPPELPAAEHTDDSTVDRARRAVASVPGGGKGPRGPDGTRRLSVSTDWPGGASRQLQQGRALPSLHVAVGAAVAPATANYPQSSTGSVSTSSPQSDALPWLLTSPHTPASAARPAPLSVKPATARAPPVGVSVAASSSGGVVRVDIRAGGQRLCEPVTWSAALAPSDLACRLALLNNLCYEDAVALHGQLAMQCAKISKHVELCQ